MRRPLSAFNESSIELYSVLTLLGVDFSCALRNFLALFRPFAFSGTIPRGSSRFYAVMNALAKLLSLLKSNWFNVALVSSSSSARNIPLSSSIKA